MKLGILGDTHFTNRAPRRRIDDYFQTQQWKFNQTLTIFEEKGCDIVVQPGDFLNSPDVANRVESAIIMLLKKYGIRIFCTWGQHDISGHSKATLSNSPLSVLEAAEVVKILDSEPLRVGMVSKEDGTRVYLYGAGFGEGVPEPYEDGYNILVTHRMIGNKPLWPGQELVGPRSFLRKHSGFNLVIAGDYHYRFVEKWNGRTVVNVGALVRKTIGKFDLKLKPAVGVFDTSNDNLEIFELDVKPIQEVFNLSKEVKGRNNIILEELVERLRKGGGKLSGWKSTLLQVLKERKSDSMVKEIIDKALEGVRNGSKGETDA